MARRLLVDDLIEEVRTQLNEQNQEVVTDDQILQTLNRAQDKVANILSRHYEAPLLTNTIVPVILDQKEYKIPEDALEQRLEKVEVVIGTAYQEVPRIDYRQVTNYDQVVPTALPLYYYIKGNKFLLLPSPAAQYPLRIWYMKDPEPFVKSQGTIQVINETSKYIVVDSIGDSLTTVSDELNSYFNVIDAESGDIKGSFQVLNISGNKITIKSNPNRTTVYNKNILTSFEDLDIQPDDVISTIQGSCVPFMKKPNANYIIQYSVAEITRSLGGENGVENQVLKELEEDVKKSWVGRENYSFVVRKNKNWPRALRRFNISSR